MNFWQGVVSCYYNDQYDDKTAVVQFRDFRRGNDITILDTCTPFASSSPSTDVLDTEWRLKHGFNTAPIYPPYCCLVSVQGKSSNYRGRKHLIIGLTAVASPRTAVGLQAPSKEDPNAKEVRRDLYLSIGGRGSYLVLVGIGVCAVVLRVLVMRSTGVGM